MAITKITLRKGVTINKGNFESLKLEVEIEAEVTTTAEATNHEVTTAIHSELLRQAKLAGVNDLSRFGVTNAA